MLASKTFPASYNLTIAPLEIMKMLIINLSNYAVSSESLAFFVDNICQCRCCWYMQSKYQDTWLSLLTTTVMDSHI